MLIVIGCNAQHKDAQTLSPEPEAKPASAPEPTEPSQDLENESLDDTETSQRKAIEFLEKGLADFRAESVDSSWAPAAESFIQGEIEKVSAKFPATVRYGKVECRQRTCLIETFHPDETTLPSVQNLVSHVSATANMAAKQQGGRVGMASHPWKNPDGSITHRAYFIHVR
jgi:hypothetical protein